MYKDKDLDALIGAELKKMRKERGFTLERIAQRMEVTKGTVFLWESGRNAISASAMYTYCGICDMSPGRFMSRVKARVFDEAKREVHKREEESEG